jgi:hypothetical protein
MIVNIWKILALFTTVIMITSVMLSVTYQNSALETPEPEQEMTTIYGYVTDMETQKPLLEVEIYFYGEDKYEEPADKPDNTDSSAEPPPDYDEYWTFTNDNGYYKMDVPSTFGELSYYHKGYESHYERLDLTYKTTLWLNVTMKPIPKPPEPDAVLKGYVSDENTGTGIPDIYISLNLDSSSNTDDPEEPKSSTEPSDQREPVDEGNGAVDSSDSADENYYYNRYYFSSQTSDKGYYEIKLYGGSYWFSAYQDYSYQPKTEYYQYSGSTEAALNTTTWFNITLKPLPPRDAFIQGYVVDGSTGKPIESLGISAYKSYDENYGKGVPETDATSGVKSEAGGMWYGSDNAYAVTDQNGFYKLNLRPGTYMVQTGGFYWTLEEDTKYDYDETNVEIGTDEKATREETPPPPPENPEKPPEESESTKPSEDVEETPKEGPDMTDIFNPKPDKEYYPFSGNVKTESKTTAWLNITLKPISPKNSKIEGKVVSEDKNEPLANAYISLIGYTQGYQNYYWDETDSEGKYSIDVREGYYVMNVNYYYHPYYDDGYYKEKEETGTNSGEGGTSDSGGSNDVDPPPFSDPSNTGNSDTRRFFPYTTSIMVDSAVTVTQDVKLTPYPEESSKLHGKVTDKSTGEGINGISITFVIDVGGNEYTKYDYTDLDGNYLVNVPKSSVTIIVNSYSNYMNGMYEDKPREETTDTKAAVEETDPANEKTDIDFKPSYRQYFGFRATVDVGAEEDFTYDIELEQIPDRTCKLTGTLYDENGSTIKYGWIALIDFDHYFGPYTMYSAQASTDENGKYTIETYPGKFGLVADSSWYLAVDGRATNFQWITFVNDDESQTVDITLEPAENNKLFLKFKFESWQKVSFTARMTLNENAFGFRYYIDYSFGNGDGRLEISEFTKFATTQLMPLGNLPFGQLLVDSVTYHPTQDNLKSVQVGIEDTPTNGQEVYSADPFTFSLSMTLQPYKPINEKLTEHDIELIFNDYMPAEIKYDIELTTMQQARTQFRAWAKTMLSSPQLSTPITGTASTAVKALRNQQKITRSMTRTQTACSWVRQWRLSAMLPRKEPRAPMISAMHPWGVRTRSG